MKHFGGAAFLCLFCWAATAQAGEIRGKDNKCLDIPGGVTEDGTTLDYRACSGAPGQQWTIKDGLITGKDGRCIDIPE
ncbi:MAG: ricin-type beta-trefoil lectin domain protein, partial [Roseiarcus sp.]